MPLSLATALVALILIVALSAGYAAGERNAPEQKPPAASIDSR